MRVPDVSLDWASAGIEAVKAAPWAVLAGAFGVWVRGRAPLNKIKEDSDKSLRNDLLKKMAEQEKNHAGELKEMNSRLLRYEDKIESQRKEYEAKLQYERMIHEGETKMFRHRMVNLEQNLNMLLALIETNPDKASDAAKRVRETRERQEVQEAAEKSTITAAQIDAARPTKG